ACEAGELFRAIVDPKDWTELKRIASFYDYLEIQPLGNNRFMVRDGTVRDDEDLKDFNRTVVKLGEELGKPVCATGDVHFLDPEDEVYRHILLASKKFADANEPVPLYFRTTDEMLKEFDYLGKEKAYEVVVTNTRAIAEQVEDIELLPKGRLFPPRLENSEEDLNRMVWGKAHELYGDDLPQLIVDRLNVELGSILGKYDVVYMSAQKLVQRSLECGYLVGSRGSVGSSLVAYMAGITEVNALPPHYRCPKCRNVEFHAGEYGCGADMPDKMCPVCGTKYAKDGFDIPFETFLGYGGGKVPDIDLNFSGEYQARAHAHAVEMFGKTQVFRAGTIGTLAEKTAYGFVKKYLEENGIAAGNAEIDRLTAGCVGVRRTTGQHPGGLVVVPDDMDIEDFCPVQHPADDPDSDTITTHFEYHCMEDNLLKLDMLGHDDPTMIRMLENLTGVNARAIPLDDPDTMSIFISSKVLGYENDEVLGPTGAVAIPEFNTRFTRQMLVDTQPKDFNTLLRLSGFSHGTDVWLGNAKDLIVSGTASVLETVGCRDDIMLYLISMGLDPKMSFKIMEAVRKGKVKGGKAGDWPMWVEEMRKHDVPEWYIESLAKIGYLFPKAHAVAYVMMAFRIAWFKVHEPLAFYATFFSIRAKAFDAAECCKDADALRRRIREIENNKDATAVEQDLMTTLEVCYEFCLRGFHFEPIDIYRSDATKFVVTENGLLPPFTSVRGLGETAALDTVEKRKGKDFTSVEEFSLCCNKLSQTHIDQLRALGAFAGLPETSQLTLF
ncbi:MAG: PolC-type DNA polymerase III, partial [Oscillibacter sp.]|nr:PolC-type DNA polymerase III [Oscillibacter sp.]